MPVQRSDRFRFGHCEFLPIERRLLVNGEPANLGGRAIDVLEALIKRAGRTVTHEELFKEGWQGLIVENNNLPVQISNLRKVIGHEAVATVPGIGYRFSALLEEALLEAAVPRSEAPMAATPHPVGAALAGNIPPYQADLIGRDEDIDKTEALLEEHRLVTITGAGGMGKTKLAQAVARRFAERHQIGAHMIELASLEKADPRKPATNPSRLIPAVSQVLRLELPGRGDALDELVGTLIDDDRLLVLDNCEHLANEAHMLARALRERTRRLRLLVTSRQRLGLADEHIHVLPPLSVPAATDTEIADHAAVRLLVARVQARDPSFKLNGENAPHAAEICRRLDGLPLAIELAAGRVQLLGIGVVRARLDDHLDMLINGDQDDDERHRTLRGTLDWSHSLLDPACCAAFRRAGAFAGSFGLAEAETVLAGPGQGRYEALDKLGELVDRSLVVVDRRDGELPRYRLLESARAYALEMLVEAGKQEENTERRHAQAYVLRFQESLVQEWHWPSQQRRAEYLLDLGNARAALEWALDNDSGLYIALAGSTAWLFAETGCSMEALGHCQVACRLVDSSTPTGDHARLLQGISEHDQSEGMHKLAFAKQAVRLWRRTGDDVQLYIALGRLAIAASQCNCGKRGNASTEEMKVIRTRATQWQAKRDLHGARDPAAEKPTARRRDLATSPFAEWNHLNACDYVTNCLRDIDEAKRLAGEEFNLATRCGDTGKRLFAMMAMEQCTATEGHYAQAAEQGFKIVELAEREGDVQRLHVVTFNLGAALTMDGQIDRAMPYVRRAALLDQLAGSLWKGLDLMAMIALKMQRPEDAARIIGTSDARNHYRRGGREAVEANIHAAVMKDLESELNQDRLERLKNEGKGWTDEDATELALGKTFAAAQSRSHQQGSRP